MLRRCCPKLLRGAGVHPMSKPMLRGSYIEQLPKVKFSRAIPVEKELVRDEEKLDKDWSCTQIDEAGAEEFTNKMWKEHGDVHEVSLPANSKARTLAEGKLLEEQKDYDFTGSQDDINEFDAQWDDTLIRL